MFSASVTEASFCFAQYCRMPAALFMLSALKAWFPLLSKLVNDASDQPPSCVVLFWLPSSLAALESASFQDAACTPVEINVLAAMAQHRRCLTVFIIITQGGIVSQYTARNGD